MSVDGAIAHGTTSARLTSTEDTPPFWKSSRRERELDALCHANHEARMSGALASNARHHLRAGCYRNPTCPDAHQRDPDRRRRTHSLTR